MSATSIVRDNSALVEATRERIERELDTHGFISLEASDPAIVDDAVRVLRAERPDFTGLFNRELRQAGDLHRYYFSARR